jgi:cobalt-zinc-cadmium efflux system outer membrane protein
VDAGIFVSYIGLFSYYNFDNWAYLEISQKNRSISEYAYGRGATSLLDYLDAERSYRSTQLSYRQAIASYLLALEQVRQAVGTRTLP